MGNDPDGPAHLQRVLVMFLDGGEDFVSPSTLESVESKRLSPYDCIEQGRFSGADDLRAAITFHRLSGMLASLIYSLNTTNTQLLAYQFKPVLQLLDSPCNGILIADEVGLGKTIEPGLIGTELRACLDALYYRAVVRTRLRIEHVFEDMDRLIRARERNPIFKSETGISVQSSKVRTRGPISMLLSFSMVQRCVATLLRRERSVTCGGGSPVAMVTTIAVTMTETVTVRSLALGRSDELTLRHAARFSMPCTTLTKMVSIFA